MRRLGHPRRWVFGLRRIDGSVDDFCFCVAVIAHLRLEKWKECSI